LLDTGINDADWTEQVVEAVKANFEPKLHGFELSFTPKFHFDFPKVTFGEMATDKCEAIAKKVWKKYEDQADTIKGNVGRLLKMLIKADDKIRIAFVLYPKLAGQPHLFRETKIKVFGKEGKIPWAAILSKDCVEALNDPVGKLNHLLREGLKAGGDNVVPVQPVLDEDRDFQPVSTGKATGDLLDDGVKAFAEGLKGEWFVGLEKALENLPLPKKWQDAAANEVSKLHDKANEHFAKAKGKLPAYYEVGWPHPETEIEGKGHYKIAAQVLKKLGG
jgi:hypothetical protein